MSSFSTWGGGYILSIVEWELEGKEGKSHLFNFHQQRESGTAAQLHRLPGSWAWFPVHYPPPIHMLLGAELPLCEKYFGWRRRCGGAEDCFPPLLIIGAALHCWVQDCSYGHAWAAHGCLCHGKDSWGSLVPLIVSVQGLMPYSPCPSYTTQTEISAL